MKNFTKTKILWITIPLLFTAGFSFSQTSWKGTVSTAWTNTSNWTAGVPTSTVDAILGDANFTGPNQPAMNNVGNCKSIPLEV